MLEEINSTAIILISEYKKFIGNFPEIFGQFLNFFILVLLVVGYAVLVWKGYKYFSKKDPLGLNLKQYGNYQMHLLDRMFAGLAFFLEYLIINPFIICILFIFLNFILIIISNNIATSQIVTITAIIVATIRVTSYYNESLSEDIAKMLPLTLLALFLFNPSSLSDTQYIETIIHHILEIPSFLWQILIYLLFIFALETVLRFFDYIYSIFQPEEQIEEEK
jgi:hypothetical protein